MGTTKSTPGPKWEEGLIGADTRPFGSKAPFTVTLRPNSGEPICTVAGRTASQAMDRAKYIRNATNAHAPLVDAIGRMLAVYEALMPGLRHIAVKDYREINEAPIAALAALKLAGEE